MRKRTLMKCMTQNWNIVTWWKRWDASRWDWVKDNTLKDDWKYVFSLLLCIPRLILKYEYFSKCFGNSNKLLTTSQIEKGLTFIELELRDGTFLRWTFVSYRRLWSNVKKVLFKRLNGLVKVFELWHPNSRIHLFNVLNQKLDNYLINVFST